MTDPLDSSVEKVRSLHDPRVRLIEGPARGIAACLNQALTEARGSIIMRCDADDLYPKMRIREQAALLRAHPEYGAICGSFAMIDDGGRLVANLPCGLDFMEITPELKEGRVRTHLCTYAIRRESARKAGGFRAFFETAEDVDFQLRLGEVCRVAYYPLEWYLYRIHGELHNSYSGF